MAADAGRQVQPLERFRAYLRFLAQMQFPATLQAKLDPSDLVQQTMLQAHQALSQFRGTTIGEQTAWLRQIFLNTLANSLTSVFCTSKQHAKWRSWFAKRFTFVFAPTTSFPRPTPLPWCRLKRKLQANPSGKSSSSGSWWPRSCSACLRELVPCS